jgi:hypothetical protein
MKTQMGRRGIALLFLWPLRYVQWMVNATPGPMYPQRREPVPVVQDAMWVSGQVWIAA